MSSRHDCCTGALDNRFVILAALFFTVALGAAYAASSGGLALAFVWPAVTYAVVGAAYLGAGPRVFGKRADGSLDLVHTVLLLPYLLPLRILWRAWHARDRRQPFVEVVAGSLFVGRRLRAHEFAHEFPAGLACVVDLTCEFESETRYASAPIPRYISLPILDQSAPSAAALVDVVRRIQSIDGPVYVHCAEGRGRAVMVACAVLIARGLASNVDGAAAIVRAKRWIFLRDTQRAIVEAARPALLALQR